MWVIIVKKILAVQYIYIERERERERERGGLLICRTFILKRLLPYHVKAVRQSICRQHIAVWMKMTTALIKSLSILTKPIRGKKEYMTIVIKSVKAQFSMLLAMCWLKSVSLAETLLAFF